MDNEVEVGSCVVVVDVVEEGACVVDVEDVVDVVDVEVWARTLVEEVEVEVCESGSEVVDVEDWEGGREGEIV